jgi:hypothetical protein
VDYKENSATLIMNDTARWTDSLALYQPSMLLLHFHYEFGACAHCTRIMSTIKYVQ